MKRTFVTALAALVIGCGLSHNSVVFAQSVPAVLKVTWAPNPAAQNVIQYQVTLDTAPPVVLVASACSASLCEAQVSVPTFGAHSVSVIAQNLDLSGTATDGQLQSSTPTVVTFSLNQAPGKSGTIQIKR